MNACGGLCATYHFYLAGDSNFIAYVESMNERSERTLVLLSGSMMAGAKMIQGDVTELNLSYIIQNFQSMLDHTKTAKKQTEKTTNDNAPLNNGTRV